VLTQLQLQIASIVGNLPEADQFALAGGAALIARGDIDRLTRDLDFFGPSAADVNRVVPVVERALGDAGLSVRRVRESPGFYRLEVMQADEVTEVDFGSDFRLLPIEQGPIGPTLAGEELAINKVLAVFGRAEARDFADLSVLTKRYGLEHLLQRAADKDPGFDRQVFTQMLERFNRLPRDEFEISDEEFQVLTRTVDHWRKILVRRSPDQPERNRDRDSGDDLGLGL
jgi:Nucleotidyl transferase AbiEii toxin, Type IV TA system